MNSQQISRRTFIKNTVITSTALEIVGRSSLSLAQTNALNPNPLPRWRGFNLLDYFLARPYAPHTTSEDDLRWIVDWGFDFVRLPMAYPRYLDIDRSRPISPADACKINDREVDRIEKLARKVVDHGLHVSVNLHRAPGYCINAGFDEPFDLWKSKEAQDAFAFHWGMWAKRFKDVPASKISFDLLNEPAVRPDLNDQHAKTSPVPGDVYRTVAKVATDAIRAVTPDRTVIADGNNVGYLVTPELKEVNVAQSCRGYYPN